MAAQTDARRARCWLEVDLGVVASNYASARRICGADTRVIPVLKANAYGLGAAKLASFLAGQGVELFAVAELNEALEVMRASGRPALVMGMVAPCQMAQAVETGAIITVYNGKMAQALDAAAALVGRPARAHIKLDTGMHRLGFDWQTAPQEIAGVFALRHLRVEGLFTHLALRNAEADAAQIARFRSVVDALREAGSDCGLLHAGDSIGMVRYPQYRFDAVRIGAWLYGVTPSRYENAHGECRVPLRLATRVVQLRRVAAGEYLGYDEDHPLRRDSVIATLSAGYADGYPRLNSVGAVEIRGRRAPVAGLVCMDQMTVDVTDIPDVREGDEATLLGGGIALGECAEWAHTNRNDLLARIGSRVQRIYTGE